MAQIAKADQARIIWCSVPVELVKMVDREHHAHQIDQDPEHIQDVMTIRALKKIILFEMLTFFTFFLGQTFLLPVHKFGGGSAYFQARADYYARVSE